MYARLRVAAHRTPDGRDGRAGQASVRGLRPIDSASLNPGILRVQIRLVCAVRDRFVSHPLAISESEVQTGPGTGPLLINGAEGGIRTPTPL